MTAEDFIRKHAKIASGIKKFLKYTLIYIPAENEVIMMVHQAETECGTVISTDAVFKADRYHWDDSAVLDFHRAFIGDGTDNEGFAFVDDAIYILSESKPGQVIYVR